MEPPVVLLHAEQIRQAVRKARGVNGAAAELRLRDRFSPERNDLDQRIDAFCREISVSIYTGLPWRTEVWTERPRAKIPDVGDDIEVRKSAGRYFAIRDSDSPDWRIVVVGGRQPAYLILGFVQAGAYMRPAYRYDDHRGSPYWRIPLSELRPLVP